MPQFDVSYYFSQAFWLVVCMSVLVYAFKNVFIPRMNDILLRRSEHVNKYTKDAEALEKEIKVTEKEIADISQNEKEKRTKIIKDAIRKADDITSSQIKAIREENDSLISGTRLRLNEEIKNLETTFRSNIEETAEHVFQKLCR